MNDVMSYAERLDSMALYLKHITEHLEQKGNQICRKYGVTIGQMRLLGAIYYAKKDYCSMKELERLFWVTQATMQGLVIRTAHKGLVEMAADQIDKRRKNVFLTPVGRELYNQASQEVLDLEKMVTSHLTAEENDLFHGLLKKVVGKLTENAH